MALILIGIDDAEIRKPLIARLEAGGDQVLAVHPLDVTPGTVPHQPPPDIVVVDGEAGGMDVAVVAAAWRHVKPRPTLVVLGATAEVRVAAQRVHATLVTTPISGHDLADRVAGLGSGGQNQPPELSPTAALRVLRVAAGGDPEDEAAIIVAGARRVDANLVREALRGHMHDYLAPTPLLEKLCARRALTEPEAALAVSLDGARTVKGAIDAGQAPPLAAARTVWGLVCGGALLVAPEPDPRAGPAARALTQLRGHLRARQARLSGPRIGYYDVLEIPPYADLQEVDRAVVLLGLRFGPERTQKLDLGNLAPLAQAVWNQILKARATLADPSARQQHDARSPGLDPTRERLRRTERDDAEAAFVRGQRALAAGDVFKSVSELAAAARRVPDEPDFEVYAAWTRVLADQARGGSRREAAQRERTVADTALAGRRPRPRAMFALALLSEAAGDPAGAEACLEEALVCDPRLSPARQMLLRLQRDKG